jgi:hypothetical protein
VPEGILTRDPPSDPKSLSEKYGAGWTDRETDGALAPPNVILALNVLIFELFL